MLLSGYCLYAWQSTLYSLRQRHLPVGKATRPDRYITLANGLLLLGAIALIVYESIDKIIHPQEINATAVIAVSSVAIFINGLTAWLLMKGQISENAGTDD